MIKQYVLLMEKDNGELNQNWQWQISGTHKTQIYVIVLFCCIYGSGYIVADGCHLIECKWQAYVELCPGISHKVGQDYES